MPKATPPARPASRIDSVAKRTPKVNNRVLQETAMRHFLEVVRSGSVTEAATRLNVAPSAVSRQIARLESEMDTLLFERRSRGMVVNAAGEALAAHAKRAWQDIERVTEEIMALRGVRTGEVRLASTAGFAFEFVPALIARFREVYTGIRFKLAICSQADIPVLIRDGEVDIGITLSLTAERNIKVELRHSSPILALMSKDHPLARRKQLALSQIVAYPLAVSEPDTTLRQLLDIGCSRQGLQYEPAFESENLDALINFAAFGGGIAFSGEVAVRSRLAEGSLVGIPLKDRAMNERQFEVQTMAGRNLPVACRAFVDHIRQSLA